MASSLLFSDLMPRNNQSLEFDPEDHKTLQPEERVRESDDADLELEPERMSRQVDITDETEDDERAADDSMEELDLDDLHNMEGPDA